MTKRLFNPRKDVNQMQVQAPVITFKKDIEPDLAKLRNYLRYKKKKQCTESYINSQIAYIKAIVGCSEHKHKGGWPSEHDTFGLDYSEEWVERVRDGLTGKVKPGTINNIMVAIENLFEANGHHIKISRVPLIDESDTAPYECLTKDQVMSIIRQANGNARNKTLLFAMWGTAARCGEISNLLVDDFKVDKDGRGKILIRHGSIKGKKSRVIPLEDDCTIALMNWIQWRESKGLTKDTHPALFIEEMNGNKISVKSIYQITKKYGKMAGHNIHPHDFRHARISYLINVKNRPVTVVQKIAGHAFLATTMRYCHVQQNDIDNAIYNMNKEE